jgi:hypothetical protein
MPVRPIANLTAFLAAAVLTASGCGGHGKAQGPVALRVTGPAESHSTEDCFLQLNADVVGGGTMRYCLQTFSGQPGPNAVVHDRGTMTFDLDEGTVRASVAVVERFQADGRHATQTLTGTLLGGTGRFEGTQGTIAGGGDVDEHPPGQIADSDLRYVIAPSS